jgi:hypothetical protein
MKIFQYTKRLPAVFERREVLSVLYQVREGLQGGGLENVRLIASVLNYRPFASDYGNAIAKAFDRHVRYDGSPVQLILESLEHLEGHLNTAEKEIKRKFGMQITNRTVTFDRAALLRFVEAAEFYADYSFKLLHFLLYSENAAKGNAAPNGFSKGQVSWLQENQADYIRLYRVMSLTVNEFQKVLSGISSAEVSEDTYDVAVKSLGRAGTDPAELFGAVGLEHSATIRLRNPIYALGRVAAERQVKKHKERKETLEALQLRLQEWRELNDTGKASPRLQKLIDHTEKRIEKLDYQILKFEEENAYSDDDYAY